MNKQCKKKNVTAVLFVSKRPIDHRVHHVFSVRNHYLSPSCYSTRYVINLKSVIEGKFSVGLFTRSKSDFNSQHLFYFPA